MSRRKRFAEYLTVSTPVLDYGWRVALYPAGTTLDAALTAEATKQAALGRVIDLTSPAVLTAYVVRTTADYLPDGERRNDDDHGWRDIVAGLGTVCLRYRVSGAGVHN